MDHKLRLGGPPSASHFDSHDYLSGLLRHVQDSKAEDPYFGEFETLQRLNVLRLQNELARLSFEISKHKEELAEIPKLESLEKAMRSYVQAIRDMEYMYKLNSVTKDVQLRTQGRLENLFRDLIPPEAFRTGYLVFPNSSLAARVPDLIREFMRKHLWYRLTWSDEEKGRRPEGYYAHEAPEGYSSTVDWLARIVVAFAAGASVVVPIVIMTVPSSSKTKDLIVLSVAVIIFGVSVSWILQSRNMDTLAATAAYAAVLVVFYGNVVNNGTVT